MITWTDYLKYRAALRGFELEKLDVIIRHSAERYLDTETGRHVVIGRHNLQFAMIASDIENETMIPVTVPTITRQQIKFRLNTRRFIHE